ncbi:uncharacterized protein LOC108865241, partial [Galendromus occidentalis]|uniref:Uncharacterized protein LOC108865241 n=1 Tax=Galendromus occidentalis TaxID=34638 RepID=A0AAJ7PBM3_9ACAR
MNLSEKCRGRITRTQGGHSSAIDYVLCNASAYREVSSMNIDEEKEILSWSDHNLITVNIGGKRNIERPRKVRVRILREIKAAEEASENIKNLIRSRGSVSYGNLINTLQTAIAHNTKLIHLNTNKKMLVPEISRLTSKRRALNREWRRARHAGVGVDEARQRYRTAQDAVRAEVARQLHLRDRKMYDQIMNAPRQARSRAFWEYARKTERKDPARLRVVNENGHEIQSLEMTAHLTRVATTLLDADGNTEPPMHNLLSRPPVNLVTTGAEIGTTLVKISEHSAKGPDEIPAKILKALDDTGYEYISEIFNQILRGTHELPAGWRKGRVALLEKPNSVKGDLTTYRPICVSDVLYRVFTRILGKHIQQWAEDTEQLSEMQNG